MRIRWRHILGACRLSSVKQFEHVNAIVTFKHSRIADIKTWDVQNEHKRRKVDDNSTACDEWWDGFGVGPHKGEALA